MTKARLKYYASFDEKLLGKRLKKTLQWALEEIERLEAAKSRVGQKWAEKLRWIPVSDNLPPLLTEVLGWHPNDRVRAWFRHSGTVHGGPREGTYWEQWSPQDRECDDCEVDEPMFWMPLPSPPDSR